MYPNTNTIINISLFRIFGGIGPTRKMTLAVDSAADGGASSVDSTVAGGNVLDRMFLVGTIIAISNIFFFGISRIS